VRKLSFRSSVVLFAFGCASLAFGDSFTIFNTGVDAGGTPLTAGDADSHYSLISAPATVPLTALSTTRNAAWTANTSTATWISPGSSGGTSWPIGDYDYRTTFSLAGLDPSTAELSGDWTSDNNACISLNGVTTAICSSFGGFGSAASFAILTGFQAGTNTLDFIVTNGGGPTGVFVDSLVGTASPVSSETPEPSSILLFGTGALGLAGLLRRRAARP
jgi:hypothetical protein